LCHTFPSQLFAIFTAALLLVPSVPARTEFGDGQTSSETAQAAPPALGAASGSSAPAEIRDAKGKLPSPKLGCQDSNLDSVTVLPSHRSPEAKAAKDAEAKLATAKKAASDAAKAAEPTPIYMPLNVTDEKGKPLVFTIADAKKPSTTSPSTTPAPSTTTCVAPCPTLPCTVTCPQTPNQAGTPKTP
jgi:hypothetical protein